MPQEVSFFIVFVIGVAVGGCGYLRSATTDYCKSVVTPCLLGVAGSIIAWMLYWKVCNLGKGSALAFAVAFLGASTLVIIHLKISQIRYNIKSRR